MEDALTFGDTSASGVVLTNILSMFMRLLANGGNKIASAELSFAAALLAYQYLKLVLHVGFGTRAIKDGVLGFIIALAWFQVATNAVPVTMAFASWMGSLGSFLSDGGMNGDVMHNPSKILDIGVKGFMALLSKADQYDLLSGTVMLFVFTALGYIVFIMMIIIGVVAVNTVLRATLDTMIGIALLPCVIEDELRPLAAQGFGLIIGAGVNLARTSLVVGATYGFLERIALPDAPSLEDGMRLTVATIVLMFLCMGSAEFGGAINTFMTGKRLS